MISGPMSLKSRRCNQKFYLPVYIAKEYAKGSNNPYEGVLRSDLFSNFSNIYMLLSKQASRSYSIWLLALNKNNT